MNDYLNIFIITNKDEIIIYNLRKYIYNRTLPLYLICIKWYFKYTLREKYF